mmetsp:Transcript_32739/g.71464  ORF Transcript_32739/g.71464 Transcript_32739/m.71464 type:complete len:437 (+) Transcript_32739:62-1372(+)
MGQHAGLAPRLLLASCLRSLRDGRRPHLPVETAPTHLHLAVSAPALRRERRRLSHSDHTDPVGALVAKGKARCQTPALGPAEVGDKACGFPRAHLNAWRHRSDCRRPCPCCRPCRVLAAAADLHACGSPLGLVLTFVCRTAIAPPKEGQAPVVQVEAHEAVKAAPWWHCRQGLNVSALDLPRSLADFPLADHRARVRTEGDAAAAASLEVHNCHAEVVGVSHDLHLQVDTMGGMLVKDIRAQAAPEVCHLVRVRHGRDLRAAEGGAECRDICPEVVEAPLPINARELPAAHSVTGITTLQLQGRRGLFEGALPLELETMEDTNTQRPPGPDARSVQLPEQAAGGVGATEGLRIQQEGEDEVRTFGKLGKGKTVGAIPAISPIWGQSHGRPLARLPTDRSCVERPRRRLEGAGDLESPMVRLHSARGYCASRLRHGT